MSSKEAQKTMAGWVAAIADNVKNPIAAVDSFLDRIEANIVDPLVVGSAISHIRKRLADLDEYVTELSEFARPAIIRPGKATAKSIVTSAILAAELPPSCTVDVDVTSDLTLQVDAAKVELALKALLRNGLEAVDASRQPRLCVHIAETATGGVSFTVEDNGAGMSPPLPEQALEPFFTTKEAGTGLGLSITKKYLDAHGGTIHFDRSPTLGGCRVQLVFPGPSRLAETKES